MSEDQVQKLRETLHSLTELLTRILMYDALQTPEKEELNFFRIYRGSLMDSVIVSWWKHFGSHSDDCHWKNLIDSSSVDIVRNKISIAMAGLEPGLTSDSVWKDVQKYRNTSAAHLGFDPYERAKTYPRLKPLRLQSEIVYGQIFDELEAVGNNSGYTVPQDMSGDRRRQIEAHWRSMGNAARSSLAGWPNEP